MASFPLPEVLLLAILIVGLWLIGLMLLNAFFKYGTGQYQFQQEYEDVLQFGHRLPFSSLEFSLRDSITQSLKDS